MFHTPAHKSTTAAQVAVPMIPVGEAIELDWHAVFHNDGSITEHDTGALITPSCPCCDGDAAYLGTLGRLTWLRCSHCGCQWSEAA